MKTHGFTASYQDWSLGREVWAADIKGCAHCGTTVFMCDGETKKPLPADVAMERCGCCDKHICRRCKLKLNSGAAVCEPFLEALERGFERDKMRSAM